MPLHAAAVGGDAAALVGAGVRDPARFARVLFPTSSCFTGRPPSPIG
jgi:hypothetical protein